MADDETQWQRIAALALSLEEYLDGCRRLSNHSPTPDSHADPSPSFPSQHWANSLAPRFPEALGTRLSWDGLSLLEIRPISTLESSDAASTAPLPSWVVWLREVSREARAPARHGAANDMSGVPFAELWLPFLTVARTKLNERLNAECFSLLSPPLWREFERHLIEQLADLADRCAFEAFEVFRAGAATSPPEPAASARAGAEAKLDSLYERFIHESLRDGLKPFFLAYPALARQLSAFGAAWVETGTRFLGRLHADLADLARVFHEGVKLGPVVALHAGLSDRHHGGQQVIGLSFASGKKLFYKPKSLRQEAGLGQLFDWFVASGALAASDVPPTARVLSRESYGWSEAVEESPAGSLDAVGRYHRRAGALLAFLHVLGGNDCVMDNLIATGAGPVVIDLETLFQPRAASAAAAGRPPGASLQGAKQFVGDSVLRTGLLPMWQRGPDGEFYDISGLAGEGGVGTGRNRPVWRNVNSDAMRLDTEPDRRPAQHNLLRFAGQVVPARAHLDSLEAGYRVAATALIDRREALLGPSGLLAQLFGDSWTRFLLRPSYVYSVLLGEELASPAAWRSGPERAMSMECLLRPFVQRADPGQDPPALWPLLRREREALERGDIPRFPIRVDAGADLVLAGEDGAGELRASGTFAESGLELAAQRLAALDESGIEAQVALLRAAFHRPTDDRSFAALAAAAPESRAELEGTPLLSSDELLARAAGIAGEIMARTVASGPDAVTWLSPNGLRLDEQTLQGGNYYLYDGNCGIALFLAACSAFGAGQSATPIDPDLIRRALRPVETLCAPDTAEGPRGSRMKGLGICVGLGSAVYSFTRIGGFLREPEYLEAASRIAAEFTDERIASDRVFDVFGGAAGAILSLLALHRLTGEKSLLTRALQCGRHLAEHQRPAQVGGSAWIGTQGGMPVGFAHGAAGAAYALSRLSAAARTDEFLDPMRAALDYERARFRPEALNWPVVSRPDAPDAAGPERPVFLNAWCNGAAGIGLGRLGMLPAPDDASIRADIDAARRKNILGGLPKIDFLCCGNFGRIEFLLTAGRRLPDPAAEHEARLRAALAVQRAGEQNAYSFGPDAADDQCFHPGFFRGLAGIGYQLLRLAKPSEVPSVLLFE